MKRVLPLLAIMAAVVAASRADSAEEKPHPNVVVFLVDDLGWKDLSCQGSTYYRTPNIDRLAENGVRFTNAYAACAVCSPTRASLLTGKYPARLLLTQWLPAGRWDPDKHRMKEARFLRSLPLEEFTLAEVLRGHGYRTWHVGKWHLGGAPFSLPEHHGFDVNVAGSDHGAPGSYFYPYRGNWEIPTTGQVVHKQTLPDGEEGEYLTDRLTEEAALLIESADEDPFLLYFPYYAVHTPLQAKEEAKARYEAIPKEERQGNPAYAAMVEAVDDSVGRILSLLEESGRRENTVIVFTSDNGGFARATDNSPLRANKGSHYEGGIRVPLIVSGPGVRTGVVSEELAISSDLFPTVLGLAGLPREEQQHLDGVDLSGHLREGTEPGRKALFWHYPHYNRHPHSAPVSIVREGNLKLIEFLEEDRIELYDLDADPGETEDLHESQPALSSTLLKRLRSWKNDVGADPMAPNPRAAR